MAEFEVIIPNLPELRRAFREYPKISEPILQKAIVATQFIFQRNNLKDNPTPWRTGNLLQSFRFAVGRLQARYYPTARYAAFVEFGTRPHLIMPNKASVLAWPSGGSTGRYVASGSGRQRYQSGSKGGMSFAMRVNHPGTKPQPYMQKIVDKSKAEVTTLFIQAGDLINRAIANRIR